MITGFEWDDDNREHIARHQVQPEEVEEACFSEDPRPRVERSRGSRPRRGQALYYVLGQTGAGRHLCIILKLLSGGRARVITARPMDARERRRYEGK